MTRPDGMPEDPRPGPQRVSGPRGFGDLLYRPPQKEKPGTPATGKAPWSAGDVVRGTAVAVAAVIAVAAAVILFTLARCPDDGLSVAGGLWLLALQTGILAGAAWLFSIRKYGGGLAALGFRSPIRRRPYLFAAGAWTAAFTVAAAWSMLMVWAGPEWLKPPDSAGRLTEEFGTNLAGLLIVAVVWGPVGEEVFFRGFVLPGLIGRFGVPAAVVVSSGLFALFHLDPGMLVPTFLLGAALAWIYLKTGSIWPSIMAHGMQNALALWLAGAS